MILMIDGDLGLGNVQPELFLYRNYTHHVEKNRDC